MLKNVPSQTKYNRMQFWYWKILQTTGIRTVAYIYMLKNVPSQAYIYITAFDSFFMIDITYGNQRLLVHV